MSAERPNETGQAGVPDEMEPTGLSAEERAAIGAAAIGAAAIGAEMGAGTTGAGAAGAATAGAATAGAATAGAGTAAAGSAGGTVSGLLGSIGAALGPAGLAAVGAGALAGVVAMSGLIAGGAIQPHPAPRGGNVSTSLALTSCANDGPVVAMANPGEKMLFTGRSADGKWLQVYVPGPAIPYGWVPATAVHVQGDLTSLPIASCTQVAQASPQPESPSPSTEPGETPPFTGESAAPTAVPSTSPSPSTGHVSGSGGNGGSGGSGDKPSHAPVTPAPVTPAPVTPAPVTPAPYAGPKFGGALTVSVPAIYTDPNETGDCPSLPYRALLTVPVSAPAGLASVRVWAKGPGAPDYVLLTHAMNNYSGVWKVSLTGGYMLATTTGTVLLRAVATDVNGLSQTSNTVSVSVTRCDTDATITGGIDELPVDESGALSLGRCLSPTPVPWFFSVHDPDGAVSTAVVALTFSASQQTSMTTSLHHSLASHWTGSSPMVPGSTSSFKMNWVLTTTDVNGGTTSIGGSSALSCIPNIG